MANRVRSSLVKTALLGLGLGGCVRAYDDGFWRYPYWNRYEREFQRRFRPPQRLRAPDLRPRSGTPFVQGNGVGVPVKVENQGDAISGPFNVEAEVAVPGQPPQTFTMRFPDLDPGEDYSAYIGTVTVPAARPVDISVKVTADPPTPANSRGEIWEWDEANNVRTFPYRIQ